MPSHIGYWPAAFDGGIGRWEHERLFTPEIELLFTLPAAVRYYAKREIYERIRRSGHPRSVAEVKGLWKHMLPELGLTVSMR